MIGSFGFPVIHIDTIHNSVLFMDTSTMFDTTSSFFNWEAKFYFAIIASNEMTWENNLQELWK